MNQDVKDILARHKHLADERRTWEGHWQDLAEVMLPRRADFTGQVAAGGKRTDRIYDGTPMLARRGLSSAIDGLLTPKTSQWFQIKVQDDDLAEDDEVKAWIDESERRLMAALYDPKARFIQSSGEVNDDLVTFGTGCLYIGESRDLGRLHFRSYHLKYVFPAENGDGVIDTVFIRLSLTARQAEHRYGIENLGAKTREALKGETAKPDTKFEFLWLVRPRGERNHRRRDSTNLPFESVVIDIASEHVIKESGYHEFPFAIPRWDTASGELFGRSPGMLALPDANTLQAMGRTLLIAGQKAVDPPLLAASDSVLGTIKTFPGGVTPFDVTAAEGLGGRFPVQPLNTGGNIPLGREMQSDVRDQIWAAFFRNILQLPVAAPQMTATEVLERKEEFIRTIGPVFGRLEGDYVAPRVERSFAILMRGGAFPRPPDVLAGRDVDFTFASPVEQARKQIEAASMARSFELLAPLAQAQPGIWENFDGDAIARDTPDIFGTPRRWLRDKGEVEAGRQRQAEAAEAASTAQGIGQAADAAKRISDIPGGPEALASALSQGIQS